MNYTGTAGNDHQNGSATGDTFDLSQGGNDTINTFGGQDRIELGDALTAADKIDGGTGADTVYLDGDTHITLAATTLVSIETLTLNPGHNYSITTNDATVAAGQSLHVNANTLVVGNTFAFKGSAETNGDFNIFGSAGNDHVTTGAGDDSIYGYGGQNTLAGGAGDDFISSGGQHSALNGGAGYDFASIDASSALSSLTFVLGSGVSTLSGFETTVKDVEAVSITGGGGLDHFTGGDGGDAFYGNGGSDVLLGGGGDDVLEGGIGANTLNGGTGNDEITSSGTDTIIGGSGFDYADISRSGTSTSLSFHLNASGTTTLTGDGTTVKGVEAFELTGGSGSDTFVTGASNDELFGGGGNDVLTGGGGQDFISGGSGSNALNGGAGNDDIQSITTLSDSINGGAGIDDLDLDRSTSSVSLAFHLTSTAATTTLVGDGTTVKSVEQFEITTGSGSDNILTGAGDDSLHGGAGGDTLGGGDGNDFLQGGSGSDILDGGKGADTAGFSDCVTGVVANLAAGTATGDGTDTLVSIESLSGGIGNDMLTGDAHNNTLSDGNGGSDTMKGGAGNDFIESEFAGTDHIDGGSGNDTVEIFASSSSNLTFHMTDPNATTTLTGVGTTVKHVENILISGGSGDDNFATGAGKDVLDGGAGHNVLSGGAGNDTLTSEYDAVDKLNGGSGNDIANIDKYESDANLVFHVTSTTATTVLQGDGTTVTNVENFYLEGGDGNDHFTTLGGNDTMYGGNGNDVLNAGDGKNFLQGDDGMDRLIAGKGNDTFSYGEVQDSTGLHHDTIVGFDARYDHFLLFAAHAVRGINAAVNTGGLAEPSFDRGVAAAMDAHHLGVYHAALFTASAGSLAGHTYLLIDANGVAGYQAGADYVIELSSATHLGSLSAASFEIGMEK